MTSLHTHFVATICLTALAACTASPMPVGHETSRESLSKYSTGLEPGCAEGIFGPGSHVTYRLGGYADISVQSPITEHTQFLIASMSKQFTALAVVTLAARGRLRLDDPARRWVPELAGAVGEATIEQLLHHTAGVRDHVNLLLLVGVETLASVDRAATLAMMANQQNTNFPPGTQARYSNGNYLVLSEIVARASGEPLERYAARAIFRPLHMNDSFFLGGGEPRALAQGYQPTEGGTFAVANDRPATNGSGGVTTTLADLQRFDADFRAERVVWRAAIKKTMLSPGRLNNGDLAVLPEFGTPYGMGLGLADEGKDIRIFHDGGAEGFRAEYTRLLQGGVSVAVLCNRVDAPVSAMASADLRSAAHLPEPGARPRMRNSPPDLAIPSPALLQKLGGTYYSHELSAEYEFRPENDGYEVTIKSPYSPGAPLVEIWGRFRLDGEGALVSGPIHLKWQEGDNPQLLELSFGARAKGLTLKRIAPP